MPMSTPATQGNSSTLKRHLDLETTRPSASTGTLELATLALDVGLLVLVGTHAEVLDGLTGVLGTTEEDGVGTGREAGSDLVDGEDFATGLLDTGTSRSGDAEGSNGELGELQQAVVVGDCADNDNGLVLVRVIGVLVGSSSNDLGQADRYSKVSTSVEIEAVEIFLRGRLILDIIRRRKTTLLKGASVRPVELSAFRCHDWKTLTYGPGTCTGAPTTSRRGCRTWAPLYTRQFSLSIMLRPKDSNSPTQLNQLRRLDGEDILRCPSRT